MVQGVEHTGHVPCERRDYDSRAWCFLESETSKMGKHSALMVLDITMTARAHLIELLHACTVRQPPPLVPAAFHRALADKKLGVETDRVAIAGLFEVAFRERLLQAQDLDWRDRRWGIRGKDDCNLLCDLFASGLLTKCWRIDLRNNFFRREECQMIREAIESGTLKGLGFSPSDVRLDPQHGRPEVRMYSMEMMKW